MSKTRIGALAEIDPVDPFERTLSERDDSPHYAAVLNDEQLLLDPDSQPNPKKQYMLPNDRERDVLPDFTLDGTTELIAQREAGSATVASQRSVYSGRPENAHDYIMITEMMEWEKKGPGSVWHKTEYSFSKNGCIYRRRLPSGKELAQLDLRYVDIDIKPSTLDTAMATAEQPLTSIRITKFDHDGSEHVWYIKNDDLDTLSEWYTELKEWKDDWHHQDWKKNLFVQVSRVPVNLEKDFDLAKAVASERQLTGKEAEASVVFDQDFSELSDEEPVNLISTLLKPSTTSK